MTRAPSMGRILRPLASECALALAALTLVACGSAASGGLFDTASGVGGSSVTTPRGGTSNGGALASFGGSESGGVNAGATFGGSSGLAGASSAAGSGTQSGGANASGAASSGGSVASASGGSSASGGASVGGAFTGGSPGSGGTSDASGGSASNGGSNAAGGLDSGGTAGFAAGGASLGGESSGGAASGGMSSGGAPACDPNAPEVCDGVDDNCNGAIDEKGACPPRCSGFVTLGQSFMLCQSFVMESAASATCQAQGMRLVHIESADKNSALLAAIQSFVASAGPTTTRLSEVYIGATDAEKEGSWHWIGGADFWSGAADGTPVDGAYSNWSAGRPNNIGLPPGEDCATMVVNLPGDGNPGQWNDVPCTNFAGVLCEKP